MRIVNSALEHLILLQNMIRVKPVLSGHPQEML